MAGEVSKPHAHLFRTVFGEKAEAAGLLRAHLPEAVSGELRWSSIQEQEARQEGRHEGRQEGELRGKVLTIEGFLGIRAIELCHYRAVASVYGHRTTC